MKLLALLSWYDEHPAWLERAIVALNLAGVDHVVAVDGAYAEYPRAKGRSGIAQHEAITRASYRIGAGVTIHVPGTPWPGGEVEKRSFMFALADTLSSPIDWHLIVDADEVLTAAPADLKQRLATSTFDVADVTFNEPNHAGGRKYPIPILYRARLGLRCETNHYTYVDRNGRKLWGNATTDTLAPRLDLSSSVRLDHLTKFRHEDRRRDALAYYERRDRLALEAGDCAYCEKPAVAEVPAGWREAEGGWAAGYVAACAEHAEEKLEETRRFLRSKGVDPDRAIAENRSGPAPGRKRQRTAVAK